MQFDADEDGEPFFKPPAIASAPLKQPNDEQDGSKQRSLSTGLGEGETDQAAAAAATVEQEE